MTVERMLYRRYKTSFSDCEIIPGTYDKATKTIEVEIPEGRMKSLVFVVNDSIGCILMVLKLQLVRKFKFV